MPVSLKEGFFSKVTFFWSILSSISLRFLHFGLFLCYKFGSDNSTGMNFTLDSERNKRSINLPYRLPRIYYSAYQTLWAVMPLRVSICTALEFYLGSPLPSHHPVCWDPEVASHEASANMTAHGDDGYLQLLHVISVCLGLAVGKSLIVSVEGSSRRG